MISDLQPGKDKLAKRSTGSRNNRKAAASLDACVSAGTFDSATVQAANNGLRKQEGLDAGKLSSFEELAQNATHGTILETRVEHFFVLVRRSRLKMLCSFWTGSVF